MLMITLFISLNSTTISKRQNKLVIIAVIDSGFTRSKLSQSVPICKTGHKDFTTTGLRDNHGHGSHIVNTIFSRTRRDNY